MERVLITGGAGFVGSNLARHLQADGMSVIALDSLALGRKSNLPDGVRLIVGDVAAADAWRGVPEVDSIVHLAGASSAPMFADDLIGSYHNNLIGFLNVLEFARKVGARRVAYASTSSIYGNAPAPLREDGPIDLPNFYAITKYAMELTAARYHAEYGTEAVGFRFLSVYGRWEDHKGRFANLVSQFIWEIEAGRKPIVYGDGLQSRDLTNVGDVCEAVRLALRHPEPLGAEVFNVATAVATPVNDLVRILGEIMDRPVEAEYVPIPNPKAYVQSQVASIEKTSRVLGYQPTIDLRTGIQQILDWRRSRA